MVVGVKLCVAPFYIGQMWTQSMTKEKQRIGHVTCSCTTIVQMIGKGKRLLEMEINE